MAEQAPKLGLPDEATVSAATYAELRVAIRAEVQRLCASGVAREARRRTGLSIGDVAELIGATKGQVSEWERGLYAPTYSPALARYCTVLVGWLTELGEESPDAR